MHQHLQQDHIPLQILKEHIRPLLLLHPVLVNLRQPRLHQGKGKDRHQSHHHMRHQSPQDTEHQDMIQMV